MNGLVHTVTCVLALLLKGSFMVYGQGWDQVEDLGPPEFVETPDSVQVNQGEMATLQCSVRNLGTKKVVWRRKADPNPLTIGRETFVDDPRFSVQNVYLEPEWPLIIKDVQLDDAGHYECQVPSAKDRQLRQYVYLKVLEGPIERQSKDRASNVHGDIEIRISRNQVVEKGHRIVISCNATSVGGDALPDDLDWFQNGQKVGSIGDGSRIQVRKQVKLMARSVRSWLLIDPVEMDDSGVYICRASDFTVVTTRVDVLNADTKNTKRETFTKEKFGSSGAQEEELTGVRNHGRRLSPTLCTSMLACLISVFISRQYSWTCGSLVT